ncbi:MAG TPA: SUMF1/EgtB/PvdO family nonheme iron enzyme, partial [Thermotogota bacterium]|nr:SUMF1/EgtB/PvdO family nonheme iron enzyme [Thermotogota bacterium]
VTVQRGTLVDLEAQVEDGWGFEGWYEGETQMSETLLYQVEAQSNQTFQARFTEIPTYTIAAQSAPANGGNVRIDDGEWEDETSVTVPRDTEVTLEADAANGWDFNGWFEGSTKVSDNEIFQVVAEEDKTYSAKFSERTVWYTITAQSSPENGGDVRVNGGTWGDSKSATVQKGSQVTMEASPVNGWRFDGWYSGTTLVSGNATYQVVANSNKTYSARFKENLTFWMGNTRGDEDGQPSEEPVHGVYFNYSFWISPYELTFAEYDAYCADTGADYPFDNKWGRGTRPVIFVSWWDAIRYCNWLSEQQGYARAYNESTGGLLDSEGNSTTDISEVEGYRLPTEAEWEYSARGGSEDITNAVEANDYRFSGSNNLDEVGWVIGGYGPTHPVGEKAPNELGTYDQSGNVIEWCYDWFGNYENGTEPITNPIGPSSGSKRIMRGGCIRSTEQTSRTADRDYIVPGERDWYLGFRIARTN